MFHMFGVIFDDIFRLKSPLGINNGFYETCWRTFRILAEDEVTRDFHLRMQVKSYFISLIIILDTFSVSSTAKEMSNKRCLGSYKWLVLSGKLYPSLIRPRGTLLYLNRSNVRGFLAPFVIQQFQRGLKNTQSFEYLVKPAFSFQRHWKRAEKATKANENWVYGVTTVHHKCIEQAFSSSPWLVLRYLTVVRGYNLVYPFHHSALPRSDEIFGLFSIIEHNQCHNFYRFSAEILRGVHPKAIAEDHTRMVDDLHDGTSSIQRIVGMIGKGSGRIAGCLTDHGGIRYRYAKHISKTIELHQYRTIEYAERDESRSDLRSLITRAQRDLNSARVRSAHTGRDMETRVENRDLKELSSAGRRTASDLLVNKSTNTPQGYANRGKMTTLNRQKELLQKSVDKAKSLSFRVEKMHGTSNPTKRGTITAHNQTETIAILCEDKNSLRRLTRPFIATPEAVEHNSLRSGCQPLRLFQIRTIQKYFSAILA
ncbi:uncharacterized protein BDR25DRAFT_357041 [Lindgomyces ingoldianus]|uniref:Uncharacterized protein n=1 Tax=Lindgomyces ingoldianus TaxID=673940 RepID=A0ACB6QNX6_9PLEO|nr:uncharacterized protein BDR25DRAFT_357041 [Lindgomyces ingoldianus]KAF2468684.1 hypothetical protein BDR25DRAFT_357041 [Lindgomyces ingoldianus]